MFRERASEQVLECAAPEEDPGRVETSTGTHFFGGDFYSFFVLEFFPLSGERLYFFMMAERWTKVN